MSGGAPTHHCGVNLLGGSPPVATVVRMVHAVRWRRWCGDGSTESDGGVALRAACSQPPSAQPARWLLGRASTGASMQCLGARARMINGSGGTRAQAPQDSRSARDRACKTTSGGGSLEACPHAHADRGHARRDSRDRTGDCTDCGACLCRRLQLYYFCPTSAPAHSLWLERALCSRNS